MCVICGSPNLLVVRNDAKAGPYDGSNITYGEGEIFECTECGEQFPSRGAGEISKPVITAPQAPTTPAPKPQKTGGGGRSR